MSKRNYRRRKGPDGDMPTVRLGTLTYTEEFLGETIYKTCRVGSEEWYTWLEQNDRFHLSEHAGTMTCRGEVRKKQVYWYGALKGRDGKTVKVYLGKAGTLGIDYLREKAREIRRKAGL